MNTCERADSTDSEKEGEYVVCVCVLLAVHTQPRALCIFLLYSTVYAKNKAHTEVRIVAPIIYIGFVYT